MTALEEHPLPETSTRLGYYRHFKGGIYKLTGHATLEATKEPVVIYEHVDTGEVWVRPLSSWVERVEGFDYLDRVATSVIRFDYLGPELPATLPGLDSATPTTA